MGNKHFPGTTGMYNRNQSRPVCMIAHCKTCIHISPPRMSPYLHPATANAHGVWAEAIHPGRLLGGWRGNDYICFKTTPVHVGCYSLHLRQLPSCIQQCLV